MPALQTAGKVLADRPPVVSHDGRSTRTSRAIPHLPEWAMDRFRSTAPTVAVEVNRNTSVETLQCQALSTIGHDDNSGYGETATTEEWYQPDQRNCPDRFLSGYRVSEQTAATPTAFV